MSAYSFLARHYDKLMHDFNYQEYLSILFNTLKGNKGVDLACGSGTITCALASKNKKMIGIDISPEMLSIATGRAAAEGLSVKFVCQDMTMAEIFGTVDFVVSVCDGLNYLPQKKLPAFFCKVASFLQVGGQFVFDISTPYKLKEVIGDEMFFEDDTDLTYFWTNTYNEKSKSTDMDLVFFEKNGAHYLRGDESHTQYCHDINQTVKNLAKAGFSVVVLDGEDFSQIKTNSKRAIFVCQKEF